MLPNKIFHVMLGGLCAVTVSLGVAGAAKIFTVARELKAERQALHDLRSMPLALATEVFDRHGQKIGELAGERRYYLPLAKMPPYLIQAFLSAEDKDFYEHRGISLSAILRSIHANIKGGGIRQGGSTITQQLTRQLFLDGRRTFDRKIKEVFLALTIEQHLKKDEILELYLNKIFLGNRSYGVEAAARNYFRKSAAELTEGEAALLAGLPKAPSYYAPHKHPKRAAKRQALVLRRMREDGLLTAAEEKEWRRRPIRVAKTPEDHGAMAPYFMAALERELAKKFEFADLPRHGLKVYTTLDMRLQETGRAQLAATLAEVRARAHSNAKSHDQIEGAFVTLNPVNGAVLAMQGGSSFSQTQFNRSEGTRRRIGALFMPIYISLALERGYSLAHEVTFDPLMPKLREKGGLTIYEAALQQKLLEGGQLYTMLGGGSVKFHARQLGLDLRRDDITLALGYGEASPLEIARAYSVFASGGHIATPYFIERVEDAKGRVVYHHRLGRRRRILKAETAFIMSHLLRDAARFSQLQSLGSWPDGTGVMAAATDDRHNSWAIASSAKIVTAAWIGAERGRRQLADDTQEASLLAPEVLQKFLKLLPKDLISSEETLPPGRLSFARFPKTFPGGISVTLPFLMGTEPPMRRM